MAGFNLLEFMRNTQEWENLNAVSQCITRNMKYENKTRIRINIKLDWRLSKERPT